MKREHPANQGPLVNRVALAMCSTEIQETLENLVKMAGPEIVVLRYLENLEIISVIYDVVLKY